MRSTLKIELDLKSPLKSEDGLVWRASAITRPFVARALMRMLALTFDILNACNHNTPVYHYSGLPKDHGLVED